MSAQLEPFHAMAISRLAHELKAEGHPVLHMEFGQPSTGAPRGAIARAHAVLDTDGLGYWDSIPLKMRLAQHYREWYGVAVEPQQFILTCGASPALVLAFSSMFSAGDRVVLARPGYVAYRNTLKALQLVPVEVACGPETRFQLNAAQLSAMDPVPAGVVIASPANPTGTVLDGRELQLIAEVCRERGIRIISDEIYHGITYGEPARSILEFTDQAVIVSSFSKYFSMVGWRLGWLLVPEGQVHRARAFMGNMFLTAPSLSQHAALVALDSADELDGHVAVYAENRRLLLAALPSFGLTEVAPPDGAFYLYCSVRHLTDDSLAFCEEMLRTTGVATAPGIDFDPVEGRYFVRFSFALSTAEIREAISRLRPFFDDLNRKKTTQ